MPCLQVIRVMRKVMKIVVILKITTFVFQPLSKIQGPRNLNQEGKEERAQERKGHVSKGDFEGRSKIEGGIQLPFNLMGNNFGVCKFKIKKNYISWEEMHMKRQWQKTKQNKRKPTDICYISNHVN